MVISNILSKKITDTLTVNEIIRPEHTEAYRFCMEYLFDVVIYNVSLIILGALLHRLPLTIIYLLVMTPMKKFAGGAHAPTRLSCSILSYTVYFVTLLFCDTISGRFTTPLTYPVAAALCIALFCLISLFIILMAPVSHVNKPLSQSDSARLKKWCIRYTAIVSCFYALFIYFKATRFCNMILICWIIILLNQLIGKPEVTRRF